MVSSVAILASTTRKTAPKIELERFSALVFWKDGSVNIQTNKSIYFFNNGYHAAGVALNKLLKGDSSKLSDGVPRNMVDLDNPPDHHLVVLPELVFEGLSADKVTSNWAGVVICFATLRDCVDLSSYKTTTT